MTYVAQSCSSQDQGLSIILICLDQSGPTAGPRAILAREVIFLARDESRVICTFRSENIYLAVVSVVFDCGYFFTF